MDTTHAMVNQSGCWLIPWSRAWTLPDGVGSRKSERGLTAGWLEDPSYQGWSRLTSPKNGTYSHLSGLSVLFSPTERKKKGGIAILTGSCNVFHSHPGGPG